MEDSNCLSDQYCVWNLYEHDIRLNNSRFNYMSITIHCQRRRSNRVGANTLALHWGNYVSFGHDAYTTNNSTFPLLQIFTIIYCSYMVYIFEVVRMCSC